MQRTKDDDAVQVLAWISDCHPASRSLDQTVTDGGHESTSVSISFVSVYNNYLMACIRKAMTIV